MYANEVQRMLQATINGLRFLSLKSVYFDSTSNLHFYLTPVLMLNIMPGIWDQSWPEYKK